MAGLLEANGAAPAPAQPKAQAGGQVKEPGNPILEQIQAGIESSVKPGDKKNFDSMVTAGMAVMFSETTGKRIMGKLQSTQNVVADVSKGVANIVALVFNDVTAKMQDQQKQAVMVASMPASTILMCQALDTWEKITGTKVDQQTAAACQSATAKEMLDKFQISPDKVKQAVASKGAPPGQAPGAAQPPQTAQAAPAPGM